MGYYEKYGLTLCPLIRDRVCSNCLSENRIITGLTPYFSQKKSYMIKNNILKVGIIGYGAIGRTVADYIENGEAGKSELVSILCRNRKKHLEGNSKQTAKLKSFITDESEKFFSAKPDIIIEAAGQDTLKLYGLEVLKRGINLLATSVGLFTNDGILNEFIEIAEQSGSRILLASGALPAIDWMSAASLSEVRKVSITQTKPVTSWIGTPADELIDLGAIEKPTCFFQGTAREAASTFPKSSNITAMLALATAGLDSTMVNLVADPTNQKMSTYIDFDSVAGQLQVNWQGVPSELNPSTSADVPLSVVKSIRNLSSIISYGV